MSWGWSLLVNNNSFTEKENKKEQVLNISCCSSSDEGLYGYKLKNSGSWAISLVNGSMPAVSGWCLGGISGVIIFFVDLSSKTLKILIWTDILTSFEQSHSHLSLFLLIKAVYLYLQISTVFVHQWGCCPGLLLYHLSCALEFISCK